MSGNCQVFINVINKTNKEAEVATIIGHHKHWIQEPRTVPGMCENFTAASVKGTSGTATGASLNVQWQINNGLFQISGECPYSSSNSSSLVTNTTQLKITEELVSKHGTAVINVVISDESDS